MKLSTRVVLSFLVSIIIGLIARFIRYWQWVPILEESLVQFRRLTNNQDLLILLLVPIVVCFLITFVILGVYKNTFDSTVKSLIHFKRKLSKNIDINSDAVNWESRKKELARQKKKLFSKIKAQTKIRNSRQRMELERILIQTWNDAVAVIVKSTARDHQILEEVKRIERIILRSLAIINNHEITTIGDLNEQN